MVFKKLILKSFGKFQDKTIELDKGFNLVYGENEAGKSTIHKFLEAMLYGFYKPNMKNKKLSEDYEKYFPWDNSQDYSGVMIVDDENQLRLERNFMKDRDSVEVYNNETGENITESFGYDSVIKAYEPAKKIIGLNKSTYKNTVSIDQMGTKTSDELIVEIKNNIINLGGTNSMDISLDKIQREIGDKKAKIGNERSKKSNYHQVLTRVEELEEELQESTKVWDRIKQLRIEENALTTIVDEKETEKNGIEKKMYRIRNEEFEQRYKDAKRIKKEITELDDKLEVLKEYKNISKDEVNEASQMVNRLEVIKKDSEYIEAIIEQYGDNLDKLKEEINSIGENEIEIGTSEKISRDVYKYEEFENSKQYVSSGTDNEQIEADKAELIRLEKAMKKSNIFLVVAVILTVLAGLITAYYYLQDYLIENIGFLKNNTALADNISPYLDNYYLAIMILGSVLLLLIIIIFVKKGYYRNEKEVVEVRLDKLERNIEIAENRIKDIEEKQKTILSKYKLEDIVELVSEKDKKIQEEVFYQENFKRVEKIEVEMDVLLAKIEGKKVELEEKQKDINGITEKINGIKSKNNMETYVDFSTVIDRYYEYKGLETERNNKVEMFEQLTKGESFEEIYEVFEGEATDEVVLQVNYSELEETLRVLNEEIIEQNKELTSIASTISNEENTVRKIVDIVDDLNMNNQQLEAMNNKLKAYQLVEEAIEEIANKTQNNFAPELNSRVSDIIAVATDYKYTELKVNPSMEISVVDNDNNKLVSGESLSAGTIDLLYFALRIAIADIINEGKVLPIILDDCFVQYDERRLVKILELLSKQNRQIIMFSCHMREKKLLQKIVKDINVITL